MLLLDTSVAILVRDRDLPTALRVAEQSDLAALSLISVVELEGGIAAAPKFADDRRAALNSLIGRTIVLPFNSEVVAAYADILRSTDFSRRLILDRLIAATAIVHDAVLVTINGADFRDIPGLKLDVWSAPAQ